ncbi:MAG: UDP-N-acetylmuramoylalanyl-D-glutamyl-2, 6-diaminopimelate--D-alanyl-D-alanine ligase [Rhodospirillaceae bacterium]|nr:UDP-N-acetylmuramoylalanyl-D-glutamyl-2, 6-diaminopimelate--D-alanyl-D-alanine ligase [Rhodospirillaceae bacterium]
MNALWTVSDAVEVSSGEALGRPWEASGIVIDSRKVSPGDLFVALQGLRVDGHDYVASALDAGAVAAVVERRPDGINDDAPLLRVDDALAALVRFAEAARSRSPARIVAVTGSVGKTGVKDSLARALALVGECHASEGNLNNQIGAPLSLARLSSTATHGVLEFGMNHAGEIGRLSRMARPHVAMITNVEPVHMEFFESERDIALAKAEVFEGLAAGGFAVLNRDNQWFSLLQTRARELGAVRVVTFGRELGSEVRLVDVVVGDNGSVVTLDVAGRVLRFPLDAIGAHLAFNAAGVLACVHALGLDIEASVAAIRPVSAGRGRGGQITINIAGGGSVRLIDESYNASPAAMRAAFAVLAMTKPRDTGRRIAILGDMRELGESGPGLHASLAAELLAARPDLVFTVGPLMRSLRNELPKSLIAPHAQASTDLVECVAQELRDGDVVLIKGSLGTNMAPIVGAIEALAESWPIVVNGH